MLGLTEYLLILIAGIFLAIQYFKPRKNLPPGPPGLPLIGNMLQFADKPQLKQFKWAQQYGKLFTVKFGMTTAVFVNDYQLAKEIHFDSDFSDRPDLPAFHLFTGGQYGILFTNGKQWEEQRRWSLRKLRDFGFGKTSMEGIIMDEVNEVVQYFKKNDGKTVQVSDRFNVATLNSLWTLLTGKRLAQDNPRVLDLMESNKKIFPLLSQSGLVFAPWMKHIRPGAYKFIADAADHLLSFARDAVDEHLKTDEHSGDFIDEYIEEIKNTTDPSSSFYKETGHKNLVGVMSDLIQAGSETSSNTINWAICYLTQFPHIKEKIQKELDTVLGQRAVSLSDKPQLPFTEAVIQETLRYSAIVSGGTWHSAVVDKKVEGYTIPKGSSIFTNIYFIHHDPKVWGDPENFRPERFLSADGKKVVRNEHLIPFQLGRRQCLGESLARDSLFLFISTIFQKFSITKIEKEMPQPRNSFFLVPQDYNFVFKSRE